MELNIKLLETIFSPIWQVPNGTLRKSSFLNSALWKEESNDIAVP